MSPCRDITILFQKPHKEVPQMRTVSFTRRWWAVAALAAAILASVVFVSFLSGGGPVQGASPFGPLFFLRSKGEAMSTVKSAPKIEHVHAGTFQDKVLRSEVPVLVDFYADWCGPCRALGPVLEEFARETPNAKVVKVNVDESPELAGRYHVQSIPCLLVFRGSQVTAEHTGLANKAALGKLLR
jgi:thioredoxin 1